MISTAARDGVCLESVCTILISLGRNASRRSVSRVLLDRSAARRYAGKGNAFSRHANLWSNALLEAVGDKHLLFVR